MEKLATDLEPLDGCRYRIPRGSVPGMRVDGILFSSEKLLREAPPDASLRQLANVATLPGIVGEALAMPDIHFGYGFPVGGVAAFDLTEGVVSPGGIGYDINCGVRLLRTGRTVEEVRPHLSALLTSLFQHVPSGVGSKGGVRLDAAGIDAVLQGGARWAVENGYGRPEDLPDPSGAEVLGLRRHEVVVMLHTGSRGLGHQVGTDYIARMDEELRGRGLQLVDRQLSCAPVDSPSGREYLSAMAAAANFAWANRQIITDGVRSAFAEVFHEPKDRVAVDVVYDLSHNMAKVEEYSVEGRLRKLLVHRKGATRAFPAGRPEVPARYRDMGQPVLIPGDMGSASYVLAGLPTSLERSFGSACHGAGRLLSRAACNRKFRFAEVSRSLAAKGIQVRAATHEGITEEAPGAYKDVDEVVRVAQGGGLARPVARLVPLGVVKG